MEGMLGLRLELALAVSMRTKLGGTGLRSDWGRCWCW